jgi:peroxiredoxin Q/BCP
VSSDTANRHASFASSLNLPFPLLSDPGSKVAKAYGVTRAGGFLPSRRVTFVIDREGIVRETISAELNVNHHARQALESIRGLA